MLPIPVFILQIIILCKFSFNHKFFDIIDGMNIIHGILNNSSQNL